MKLSDAAKYLPFVQAAAEGKTIQYRDRFFGRDWIDCPSHYDWFVDSELDRREFRIKPEHKLRPWKPEEVPVGALIRHKEQPNCQSLILSKTNSGGINCYASVKSTATTLDFLLINNLDKYEHSLDHGKTWLPCGVEE